MLERFLKQTHFVSEEDYQLDDGGAMGGRGVAQFLVEGALIVEARGQTEGEVLIVVGHEADAHARREEPFAIPVPIGEASAVVHAQYAHTAVAAP